MLVRVRVGRCVETRSMWGPLGESLQYLFEPPLVMRDVEAFGFVFLSGLFVVEICYPTSFRFSEFRKHHTCALLYTSDAAAE